MTHPLSFDSRRTVARIHARADGNRRRADELAAGIEALIGKWERLTDAPLDIVDRVERSVVRLHTSNLLRVSGEHQTPQEAPEWASGSLHDIGCNGPSLCSCQPVWVR